MMRRLTALFVLLLAAPAMGSAADRLCDTAHEDCRTPLLELIRNERVAVDVAFWFMEDARYTAALAEKMAEGVPVRVLVDTRANSAYALNADRLREFRDAGIPMRPPIFRIGTTVSTVVCIEQGDGAGLDGWGWADNGWDSLGPNVYFATSGAQTIRVQRREDGISLDQIVMSPSFITAPPGFAKSDTTIYPRVHRRGGSAPSDDGELVLYASEAIIAGDGFTTIADPSAAGSAPQSLDRGTAKIVTALSAPATHAELQFVAEAGRQYRLWIRGKALRNYRGNDSIHVQFSDAVDASGNPVFRIGTSDSTVVNLEDYSGCGLGEWGWQDNGWGTGVLGPLVTFAAAGLKTLRIQKREDGLAIDQVVLSPAAYLERSPGALENDTTILSERDGS